MNQIRTRAVGAGLLAVVLCLAAAPAARAETAKVDETFLKDQAALTDSLLHAGAGAPASPIAALDLAHRLLLQREAGLVILGKKLPLTTFDGIETQDRFDRSVVEALQGVATKAVAADTTLPPQAQAVLFNNVLPGVPALGNKPVAFMVVGMTEAALVAADTLIARNEIPPENAAKLALRLMRYATNLYMDAQNDLVTSAQAESMREGSVVLRMRCPKDGGTYKVIREKSRLHEDGSLSHIYWLNCTVCGDPQALEFPRAIATRLNQAGSRQVLKSPPKGKQPDEGLKP